MNTNTNNIRVSICGRIRIRIPNYSLTSGCVGWWCKYGEVEVGRLSCWLILAVEDGGWRFSCRCRTWQLNMLVIQVGGWRCWLKLVVVVGGWRCWYSLVLLLERCCFSLILGWLERSWFSLVFGLERRQIHPQTPYFSRTGQNHTNFSRVIPYVSRAGKWLERRNIPWAGFIWITALSRVSDTSVGK